MEQIKIALKEYGTHDILGSNNNSRVLQYFKDIGQAWVTNDDLAWCAAFVDWVLKTSGKPFTAALNARSYLTYGIATDKPELGDIVVLWRIEKNSSYGHVGFFIRELGGFIYILGGNQADQVNISAFPKDRLLGYRKVV